MNDRQFKLSVHGDRDVFVPARFENLDWLKRELAAKETLTAEQIIERVLDNLYVEIKDIPGSLCENRQLVPRKK